MMPHDLRPKKYPDFMAKTDCATYTSEKILGLLYRSAKEFKVKDTDKWENFEPVDTHDIFYDLDLEVSGFEKFCDEAWELKCSYEERLQALMGQFNVQVEGEVVTGSISGIPGHNSRRLGDLRDRIKDGYLGLRDEFRFLFENGLTETQVDEEGQIKKLREAKAFAWYHVTYHQDWVHKAIDALESDIPFKGYLLSFPWLVAEVLCDIKNAANINR
ncbi:hypothetical protein O6H91_08G022400 [Diphasiastrum complanatum]|uniref:Uncharacterized protein n=1 Tax=Diphasiastrum complanatum TaxID=34168 RepID=A0ACC2CVP4_DIPCM|nr:hypothetical protein O6H91_08G022400 [Diphasiastrum complanatum]